MGFNIPFVITFLYFVKKTNAETINTFKINSSHNGIQVEEEKHRQYSFNLFGYEGKMNLVIGVHQVKCLETLGT